METAGEENLASGKKTGSVIYAFWHNRIFLMTYALRNKNINAMISRSRDGDLASRTAVKFGGIVIGGSSTRGGAQALVQLIRGIKKGADAAITPDGPRGPVYRAGPGVVYLAAKTGAAVIPSAFGANKKITLKSWDRFIIPLPFSRAVVVYGKPVRVSGEDAIEDKRLIIEDSLKETTDFADSYFINKGKRRKTSGHKIS